MYTIYGIKNCGSMKKAFTALDENRITYAFHDYKKQAISAEKLQQWLAEVGQEVILNKRGTTWRKLSPEQQSYALENEQQLIETLVSQPSMIKRPVLETPQGLIVGFDEAKYRALA